MLLVIGNIEIDNIIKRNRKLIKLSLIVNENILRISWKELAEFYEITIDVRYWSSRENRKEDIDALVKFANEKSSASISKITFKFISSRLYSIREYLEDKIDKNKWNLNRNGNNLQLLKK